jgi:hypothetical protein
MKRALTALETIERFLDPLAKWQIRKPKNGGPMITVYPQKVAEEAINDLRQAVAETKKQEPFCYHDGVNQVDEEFKDHSDVFPLYLAPPQHDLTCVCGAVWEGEQMVHAPRKREWVGLTDQEINSVCYKRDWTAPWTNTTFARAIEAKLKEKNA